MKNPKIEFISNDEFDIIIMARDYAASEYVDGKAKDFLQDLEKIIYSVRRRAEDVKKSYLIADAQKDRARYAEAVLARRLNDILQGTVKPSILKRIWSKLSGSKSD